ncbi:MAG: adenylosuccinate lyase [Bacteroidota bacterium]|nr:adenylosuccinate lyase [Bacteroidota bacterium]
MQLNPLTAISPIDGRYRKQTEHLGQYFSEYALIKYRVQIEIEYLLALADSGIEQLQNKITNEQKQALRNIVNHFDEAAATQIKDIEKTTNHDVKAVEYYIKEQVEKIGLSNISEFIHFGLTSQDVNNTAIPLSLKEGLYECWSKPLTDIIQKLKSCAHEWADIPMLARTHGQPASPTKLGKEFLVYIERLENQLALLKQIPYPAKFGGATGNLNAHYIAYPKNDWVKFANAFVETLGLKRMQHTTQIEHYDYLGAIFDNIKRINIIYIDLCQDIWLYISSEYFKQKLKEGEVGSSAMPHKVNPIDFENAEGNLGMANAMFEFLTRKLPVSRLQRDLTDSTVLRNIGVPIAHSVIAMKSIIKGLDKLILNTDKIHADLDNNWAVVAEAIQTILRRESYPKPYEALKALTRTNEKITQQSLVVFIDGLEVSDSIKNELKGITPFNYTGV